MKIKISRLLGLFFLLTILISVISAPVFAVQPVNKCFHRLWFTICIPIPPKPSSPPRPFPFPSKKTTPSPTIKPTSTPTPTVTPTLIATPTPTPTPIAECSATTTCGSACLYGGTTYNTVLIGTQCWFRKNLNAGIIMSNTDPPDNTAPTLDNPSTVQKWCYDDSATNCNNEGGLYSWAEANALPNSCNSTACSVSTPNQGICPAGWHIPTDSEQYTLENYLTTPGQTCDAARSSDNNAWGCSDAGDKLRLGGSSGFDALGAGYHGTLGVDSNFDKREPSAHFWSSSEQLLPQVVPSYAWNRVMHILGSGSEVYRSNYLKSFGMSVRCVANTTNL